MPRWGLLLEMPTCAVRDAGVCGLSADRGPPSRGAQEDKGRRSEHTRHHDPGGPGCVFPPFNQDSCVSQASLENDRSASQYLLVPGLETSGSCPAGKTGRDPWISVLGREKVTHSWKFPRQVSVLTRVPEKVVAGGL